MTSLRRALTDPPLRPLPDKARELLEALEAPPRLAAHLRAVHDVAWQLADWVERHHPTAAFDRDAVLFGAAVHDIGKTVHLGELSGPGSAHEPAGYEILLTHGVEARWARFARDHGSWGTASDLDDLLVSLADKVWKAKRVQDLEQLVTDRLAMASGQEPWQVFMALDDELSRIAAGADHRLAFQTSYPVTAAASGPRDPA
ncbi:HD domain-containing protein [Actinophytocola sp.]|uniref:HD domain-containing protein n=1 Tax=Actinophytocola sp. TaxID=1872138 RepID=UPI002ED0CBF8